MSTGSPPSTAGDEDWFRTDADGDTVTVTIDFAHSEGDLELSIQDESGTLQVITGLEEFREHLGGGLTITLLRELGQGFEVHEMNLPLVIESIYELRGRQAGREQSVIPARA